MIPLCRGSACAAGKQFTLEANFASVPVAVDVQGYFYPKTTNVVTVAKDGGDYLSPLDAMAYLKGLVANSDPNAPSATNPWVVQIDPGTYELGANTLVLDVPYVTVKGAGQEATILTGAGTGTPPDDVVLVSIPNKNVRLESLGIQSTAISAIKVANEADPAVGVATLADLRASDTSESALMVTTGQASIIGGKYTGITAAFFEGDGTKPTEVTIHGAEISSDSGRAVFVTGAVVTVRNSIFKVTAADPGPVLSLGPGGNFPAVVHISHSALEQADGRFDALAMISGAGAEVTVDASTLVGWVAYSTNSMRIGASRITGGVANSGGGGSVTCVASYDGNFHALGPTCQVP